MDGSAEPTSEPPATTARLRLVAALFSSRGRLTVRVVEMSADRAIAMCDDPPACGSFAILVRNGIKIPALVAWTEGDRIGLEFEEPVLDERSRAAFVHVNRRSAPAPRPPLAIALPAAMRIPDVEAVARAA